MVQMSHLDLVAVIRDYQRTYKRSPTIRELVSLTPYSSTSAVSHRLDVIERQGLIVRDRKIARSIRIVKVHHKMKKVRNHKGFEDRKPSGKEDRPSLKS